MFANLATGNPVVVKPHPTTVLPVALAVQIVRETLADAGFDPNLVALATDTGIAPITDDLVDHPATAIVDFTGSPEYGRTLAQRSDRLVYTETAGCNAVILESAHDLDPVLAAIARGLCLFSGQMCTTPQNIFIPPFVGTDNGPVPYAQVRQLLVGKIDELVADPRQAAALCGVLHSQDTVDRIESLATQATADTRPDIARLPIDYDHPDYPHARTQTPLVVEDSPDSPRHQAEQFGPVAFLIPTTGRREALACASQEARDYGAIASYAYTTDPAFAADVEEAFFDAGASIGFNLINQSPINFTAAFSDYHVTGLNPAGTACLTDLAFVADRFRIVQSKTEIPNTDS
jgi:phenylacetic acid degradation protein paaN